ncbi:MAG TPA: isoprenylcysteine carboxylmethyltransferase family protein [Chloroflexota bacterium]|nr:isoprenylcysteine carboxylmethyltransferase family protein [Chloroflexota bacterium]
MFLVYLTLGGWAVLEVGLRVRDRAHHKGGGDRDRATRVLIAVTLGASLVLASVAASVAPAPRISGPYRAVGLIVMWLGLAIRIWAIAVLGGAFRTTVEVDPGQPVVSRGPYEWVRHPSYTGCS